MKVLQCNAMSAIKAKKNWAIRKPTTFGALIVKKKLSFIVQHHKCCKNDDRRKQTGDTVQEAIKS